MMLKGPCLLTRAPLAFAQGNWDREREHNRAPGTAIRSYFGTEEQVNSPQHKQRFKDGDTRGWFLGMDSGPNRYNTSPGGGGGRGGGRGGGGAEVGGMSWSPAGGGGSPPLGITGESSLAQLVVRFPSLVLPHLCPVSVNSLPISLYPGALHFGSPTARRETAAVCRRDPQRNSHF
jgi:hypothetical protein